MDYKNKYLEFKNKKGGVFPLDKNRKNPNPESSLNCGPLVLYSLGIINEKQSQLLANRCSNTNPNKYLSTGGMQVELIKLFIELSKKSKNSNYISREIEYKDFKNFLG